MKIRGGFVSNSSSSSFVVAFDTMPGSPEEMQELLFEDDGTFSNPYGDNVYDAAAVAATVFGDVGDPLTREQVISELSGGWLDGAPDWDAFRKPNGDTDWAAHDVARREHAEVLYDEFLKKNEGKVFLRFEYSDNDGAYYTSLEHGDLFRRLEHIRISHH